VEANHRVCRRRRLDLCQHGQARPYATWLHVGMERANPDMHAPGHRTRKQPLLPAYVPQLARCAGLTDWFATADDATFQHHHHGKLRGYGSRRPTASARKGSATGVTARERHGRLYNSLKHWGGRRELNPQPSEPQSDALPIELLPPQRTIIAIAAGVPLFARS
jgi:hypothetical protein